MKSEIGLVPFINCNQKKQKKKKRKIMYGRKKSVRFVLFLNHLLFKNSGFGVKVIKVLILTNFVKKVQLELSSSRRRKEILYPMI